MRGNRFHREMPDVAQLVALHSLFLLYHHLTLPAMSELDADLYGGKYVVTLACLSYQFFFVDLYGTEDLSPDPTIENSHATPQENPLLPELQSPTPAAEPAVKNVAAAPPQTSAVTSPIPIASWSEPSSIAAERPAPPPATNVPQQIPTYQESNSDDRGLGRNAYHGVAVEERSVRPSEMKDEG